MPSVRVVNDEATIDVTIDLPEHPLVGDYIAIPADDPAAPLMRVRVKDRCWCDGDQLTVRANAPDLPKDTDKVKVKIRRQVKALRRLTK